MPIKSYEHEHERLLEISWEEFGRLALQLAKQARDQYAPDCVVGNSKGGCIIGGTLAAILRLEFYPMRVSRRLDDEVIAETPRVILPPSDEVAGRKVLLVDDMSASGSTFEMVSGLLTALRAREIRSLSLARHCDSWIPDFCAIVSDDAIAFPWDRWTYDGREFVIHPELVI
jgi:uncharacterized protein